MRRALALSTPVQLRWFPRRCACTPSSWTAPTSIAGRFKQRHPSGLAQTLRVFGKPQNWIREFVTDADGRLIADNLPSIVPTLPRRRTGLAIG
jgi:hypothetical protein